MTDPRDRILVTYSTKLGSTGEVAEFIGRVLAENGAAVDVMKVSEVGALDAYDRVVVGSAIRYDRWLGDARSFVTRHQQTLSRMPVSLFLCCLAMSDDSPKGQAKGDVYARKVAALLPNVDASDVGRFAGVHDTSKAPLLIRLILRVITRVTGVEEGDYRDWDAIRAWSRGLIASD